jgi:hypothetical protein
MGNTVVIMTAAAPVLTGLIHRSWKVAVAVLACWPASICAGFVGTFVALGAMGGTNCLGCSLALLTVAWLLAFAWEMQKRARAWEMQARARTPDLPPEVLDPAVRAKVGEAIRPGKPGDEGIEARDGVQGSG